MVSLILSTSLLSLTKISQIARLLTFCKRVGHIAYGCKHLSDLDENRPCFFSEIWEEIAIIRATYLNYFNWDYQNKPCDLWHFNFFTYWTVYLTFCERVSPLQGHILTLHISVTIINKSKILTFPYKRNAISQLVRCYFGLLDTPIHISCFLECPFCCRVVNKTSYRVLTLHEKQN